MPEPTPPQRDNREPGRPERPAGPKIPRSLLGWALFAGLAMLLLAVFYQNLNHAEQISASTFWQYVQNGDVTSILVKSNSIEGKLRPNIPGRAANASDKFTVNYTYKDDPDFLKKIDAKNHPPIQYSFDTTTSWWVSLLPNLLIWGLVLLVIWFFFFRQFRAGGGAGGFLGSFGRSRARMATKEHVSVTFDDVAGIEEAKEEVREIIEFLKNAKRFQRLGARIPRGVLLVGLPGCGKTLLAKAIAGEAEVPFFSISGSDFVEMFVGVGASRVRDLFKQAKESAPCIIFLDEIDAVGRRRGANFNGGGHDEREQTLNAILVEMDGFDSSDQVIVIAATNRVDVLDPALTRPGRFDRQITVPLPDIEGRLDILKIYAAKVRCGPDVDLRRLARGTPMFSGADLAALINEAAIAATLGNKDFIEQADLEEARDKVRWGRARRSRKVDEQEKKITAYHEAGHTLVQALTPGTDPVHKVSIIPRGQAGGATFSLPEKDRYIWTREYCLAALRVCMGGRLAEQLFCDDISSGAAGDIEQATEIARRMVLDWGMSEELGFVNYNYDENRAAWGGLAGKNYSDATAQVIDAEIRRYMDEARQDARKLLEDNRDKIEALSEALLKYETLDGDEVRRIIEGQTLTRPSVNDLLEAEHAKRAQPASPSREKPTTDGPPMGVAPQPN